VIGVDYRALKKIGAELDQVMDGALAPVVESCITADEESRLAALSE
jgi:protein subunit release factor A